MKIQLCFLATQNFYFRLDWLRSSLILFCLNIFGLNVVAQTKLWDQTFGGNRTDNLQIIIQTADEGYLLGGSSLSDIGGDKSQISRGKEDYWVVKTDANGNKIWDKTFGGDEDDVLTDLVITPDGYLLAGTSSSGISCDKTELSRGRLDYWVIKIDLAGNKLWDKRFGGDKDESLAAVLVTPDGYLSKKVPP